MAIGQHARRQRIGIRPITASATAASGAKSFYSTAHGSGRTMSRTKARKLVKGETLRQELERRGIRVRAASMRGLAEEAGLAAARRPDPVIERDGYRCLVPGCSSRRNLHDHHVAFRSAEGSDDPANRVTLCAFHPQRCLHTGRMRILGRAPDALMSELARRPGGAALARYRSGDVAA